MLEIMKRTKHIVLVGLVLMASALFVIEIVRRVHGFLPIDGVTFMLFMSMLSILIWGSLLNTPSQKGTTHDADH